MNKFLCRSLILGLVLLSSCDEEEDESPSEGENSYITYGGECQETGNFSLVSYLRVIDQDNGAKGLLSIKSAHIGTDCQGEEVLTGVVTTPLTLVEEGVYQYEGLAPSTMQVTDSAISFLTDGEEDLRFDATSISDLSTDANMSLEIVSAGSTTVDVTLVFDEGVTVAETDGFHLHVQCNSVEGGGVSYPGTNVPVSSSESSYSLTIPTNSMVSDECSVYFMSPLSSENFTYSISWIPID